MSGKPDSITLNFTGLSHDFGFYESLKLKKNQINSQAVGWDS